MNNMKMMTVKKCVSLLKQYIEDTNGNTDKNVAILALDQLQRISAGNSSHNDPKCIENQLADGAS